MSSFYTACICKITSINIRLNVTLNVYKNPRAALCNTHVEILKIYILSKISVFRYSRYSRDFKE